MSNGKTAAPSPSTPTPGTQPARPTQVDEPLDASTAMVYSPKAPLASNAADVREDTRAVWTHVSTGFDPDKPSVLIYLHGHNNFVTATLNETNRRDRPANRPKGQVRTP